MATKKYALDELIHSSKSRILKLELLDSYSKPFKTEKEWLAYYLKHKKLGPIPAAMKEWYKGIKKLRNKGVESIRIHVVTVPVSDYVRFEIESYKISEKCGEQIYLIDRKDFQNIRTKHRIKITDFIVFDGQTVAFVNFKVDKNNNAKKYIGNTYAKNKRLAENYASYYESLLKRSMPLKKFIKENIV